MPQRTRVIVYIDGFNLYFGLRARGWRRFYWLDLGRFAERLLKPGQTLVGVKYFTSRISGNPKKERRQSAFIDANRLLATCEMYFGQYQSDRHRCPRCATSFPVPREKMTDVNIAVELMADAARDAFDTAIVVSADADLTRAFERIREIYPRKRLVVAFPPQRSSMQLRKVAHAWFHIGRRAFSESQLPEEIPADEYTLRRPDRWR